MFKNLQILIFSPVAIILNILVCTKLLGMQSPKLTLSQLIKKHELPYRGGLIRYIPPKNCNLSQGLPTVQLPDNKPGFIDKFGNIWKAGRGITANEEFEWDVQLAKKNKNRMKSLAANDGNHVNVSLTGRVTHY
jgi:hypothetical protein